MEMGSSCYVPGVRFSPSIFLVKHCHERVAVWAADDTVISPENETMKKTDQIKKKQCKI